MRKILAFLLFYMVSISHVFAQGNYLSSQIVNLFAGGGDGNGGLALSTSIYPHSIASDQSGNIYISNAGSGSSIKIRKINNSFPQIVTNILDLGADGMAADANGNLFLVNNTTAQIFKYTQAGQLSVIAGTGTVGYSGDGGLAINAQVGNISSIAVASSGELFFLDTTNHVLREITTDGNINTFASSNLYYRNSFVGVMSGSRVCVVFGNSTFSGVDFYNFAGIQQSITYGYVPSYIVGIATNASSNFLYFNTGNQIYVANVPLGFLNSTPYAGNGSLGNTGDGGAATSAQINPTGGISLSGTTLFISNGAYIRSVSGGIISKVAGNGTYNTTYTTGDGLAANLAGFGGYYGLQIAADQSGNFYVADNGASRIRMVNSTNIVSTIAGGGILGRNDGGNATDATLNSVTGIATDNAGNFYFADAGNKLIRKVNASGIITTIAGGGSTAPATGVLATNASLGSLLKEVLYLNNSVYYRAYNSLFKILSNGTLEYVKDLSSSTPAGAGTVSAICGYGNFIYAAVPWLNNSSRILKINLANFTTTQIGTFAPSNSPGDIVDFCCDQSENFYWFNTAGRMFQMDNTGSFIQIGGYLNSPTTQSGIQLADFYYNTNGRNNSLGGGMLISNSKLYFSSYNVLYNFSMLPLSPTITSFTPTAGLSNATITITGTNFTGATAVSFGGTAATSFTVVNATTITAVVGAGASGNVSVTTPGGTASIAGFTFTTPPVVTTTAPATNTITPSTATMGGDITVDGNDPIIHKGVVYNTTGSPTIADNVVNVPGFRPLPGATITTGTGPFSVTLTGLNNSTTYYAKAYASNNTGVSYGQQITFSTLASAPAITSFNPTSANTGTVVTISGTNFTGATSVSFGGTAATLFTVVNATTITAVVGAGASGSISVTTPGGTANWAGFTYCTTVPPSISIAISPSAIICSGTPVTFIATTTNGGSTPIYQWKKNGNIVGASSATYATATLADNDVITCVLTSNATCATTSTATSNAITMTVLPLPLVGTNVFPVGTVCEGTQVTLNGTGAVSYTWSNGVTNGVPFIPAGANPFSTKKDFVAGSAPQEIALDDIDGDGKKDIVVTNYQSNTISVFRNTSVAGSLSNSSYAAKVDFPTGVQPFGVAIADIDGDGKKDILVANAFSNTISVFRNTSVPGNINSSSLAAKIDFAAGDTPYEIATGDIDADGKKDIIVSNGGLTTSISIFKNVSTPGNIVASSLSPKVDFTANFGVHGIAVDDIDGDGKPDVVAANYGGNTISVFRNGGLSGSIISASLESKVDFLVGSQPYSVAIGDIDGDGKKDIAYVNSANGNMGVYRNTSTAGIINTASLSSRTEFVSGSFPLYLAIGDINGDGKNDIVVANPGSNTFSYYKNTATLGSISSSTFSPGAFFASGNNPRGICIGDIDGDGKNDLAIANGVDNTFSIFGGQSAAYTVTGTGSNGCSNTSTITLLFNSKPIINTQPSAIAQSVCLGFATQSLSVSATAGSGTVAGYQWYSNTTASNTGGSLLTGATAVAYTPASTIAGTFYYYCVVTNSNGCTTSSDVSGSVVITVCTGNYWTGIISNDWNIAGNWSNGVVPTGASDALIPSGNTPYPVLSASSSVNNLAINAGATVKIGSNTLTINGAVTGTGTLSGSATSNVVTNANTTLLFTNGANTLKGLTVNAGTTTLGNAVNITGGTAPNTFGTVTVANGATLASNGNLNIKSNQFGTARVSAGAIAGNYITGDVTVERYINQNTSKAWRLLSVPTKGTKTIKQTWQENQGANANGIPGYGTIISSNAASLVALGFDAYSGAPSIQSYNSGTQIWNYLTSTNSTPIETTKGYFMYIRGDRSVGVSTVTASVNATTLRTTGTLYQGNNTTPVSIAAGKFEPVGNIFASAIDFTGLTKTGGISNTFYVWDSKLISATSFGGYQTFNGSLGFTPATPGGSYPAGIPNTTIESGEAIMLGATGTAGTIAIPEGSKVTGNQFNPFRPSAAPAQFRTSLYRNTGAVPLLADNNIVVFDNAYSNAADADDAMKIPNRAENLGIIRDNKTLIIDARQPITSSDEINLSIGNLQAPAYKFTFSTLNMNTAGLTAWLQDNFLHTSTVINLDAISEYNFTIDAGNAASAAPGRFKVVFKKSETAPINNVKPSITISPNPVEGTMVSLQFKNQPKGRYQLRLLGNGGQLIISKITEHAGGNATQTLNLPAAIARGSYQVEIIAPDKTKQIQTLFISPVK